MRIFVRLVLFSFVLSCYGYSYGDGDEMHHATMQIEQKHGGMSWSA